MVFVLKRIGFNKVFDTVADFTIMEEGTELIERIRNGEFIYFKDITFVFYYFILVRQG